MANDDINSLFVPPVAPDPETTSAAPNDAAEKPARRKRGPRRTAAKSVGKPGRPKAVGRPRKAAPREAAAKARVATEVPVSMKVDLSAALTVLGTLHPEDLDFFGRIVVGMKQLSAAQAKRLSAALYAIFS